MRFLKFIEFSFLAPRARFVFAGQRKTRHTRRAFLCLVSHIFFRYCDGSDFDSHALTISHSYSLLL